MKMQKKLKQVAIYPIDKAKIIDEKLHDLIPKSDKELRDLYNFAHSINENIKLRLFIRNVLRESVNLSSEHGDYLKWKRKNVSFRGMQNVGEENGGAAMLGRGLYTASLSNKSMSKKYGKPYFAVNAVPKHPKIFNTLNEWEIWFQNALVYKISKEKGKNYPDARDFFEKTTIEDEMQKLGYDGIIIKGREMVNFTPPENVRYFRTEDEVKQYYMYNIHNKTSMQENFDIDEEVEVYHGSPHEFEQFKLDAIGTGEGNQSYGWGLYFTELQDIANHYANKLTERRIYLGNNNLDDLSDTYHNQAFLWIKSYVFDNLTQKEIIERLENMLTDKEWITNNSWAKLQIEFALEYLSKFKIKVEKNPTHVYKVILHKGKNSNNYDWLSWKEPIPRHQIEKIKLQFEREDYNGRIKIVDDRIYKHWGGIQKITIGSDFYRALAGDKGYSEKAASEFLSRAGIDGIKYPPDEMRGDFENHGKYNYVIFNPNIVSIEDIHKF